jgi:hypothetical protein
LAIHNLVPFILPNNAKNTPVTSNQSTFENRASGLHIDRFKFRAWVLTTFGSGI